MLTKSDLNQIRTIVREEVKDQVNDAFSAQVPNIIDSTLKKELKPIKEDITKIRKDMKTIVGFFDAEYLQLRKRIERIEELLKISPVN